MTSLRFWISTLFLALALLVATGCSRREPVPESTAEAPSPPPAKSEPTPPDGEPPAPPEEETRKATSEESPPATAAEAADESSVADGGGAGDSPEDSSAPAGTTSSEPGGRSSSGRSSSGRPTAPPAAFGGRPKRKQNPTPDAAARVAKKQLEAAQAELKLGHSAAALTAAIAAYEAASEYAEGSPQCDRLAREAEKLVDTIGGTSRPAAVVATEFE